jgi:hypothetical protein
MHQLIQFFKLTKVKLLIFIIFLGFILFIPFGRSPAPMPDSFYDAIFSLSSSYCALENADAPFGFGCNNNEFKMIIMLSTLSLVLVYIMASILTFVGEKLINKYHFLKKIATVMLVALLLSSVYFFVNGLLHYHKLFSNKSTGCVGEQRYQYGRIDGVCCNNTGNCNESIKPLCNNKEEAIFSGCSAQCSPIFKCEQSDTTTKNTPPQPANNDVAPSPTVETISCGKNYTADITMVGGINIAKRIIELKSASGKCEFNITGDNIAIVQKADTTQKIYTVVLYDKNDKEQATDPFNQSVEIYQIDLNKNALFFQNQFDGVFNKIGNWK